MRSSVVKRSRTFIAVLSLFAMLFHGFSPGAMAQQQTYTSVLTGTVIAASDPYVLELDSAIVEDGFETVFVSGPGDFLISGFFPAGIDMNTARDVFLETFFGELGVSQQIDRGDYPGVSYSLDMVSARGVEVSVFTLFFSDRPHGKTEFYLYLAPPASFATMMQSLQRSVTVNGAPVFDGVDANVMGQYTNANIGITGGRSATSVTELFDIGSGEADSGNVATSDQSQGTGTSDAAAYLNALTQHREEFGASIILTNKEMKTILSADASTEQKQASFQAITAEAEKWAGYGDRARMQTPPAGYEALHQSYLAWADEITTLSGLWFAFAGGDNAAFQQFFDHIRNVFNVETTFASNLEAANEDLAAAPEETANPSQDSTEAVGSGQQGTGSEDPSSYVSTLSQHHDEFFSSINVYADQMDIIKSDASKEEKQAAIQAITAEAQKWAGYGDRARMQTAPAGYETLHETYLTWADEISMLGEYWLKVASGDAAAFDLFFDQLDKVMSAELFFVSELTSAKENPVTAPEETADPTQESTEAVGSGQSATGSADASSYLSALTEHHNEFFSSINVYSDQMDILKSDAPKEDKQVAIQAITAEAQNWAGYGDRARMQTAPAGYDKLHEAYLKWADEITTLGEYWLAVASGDAAAFDLFFDQFDKVVNAELIFISELTSANENQSTAPEETADPTQESTEAVGSGQPESGSADSSSYISALTQHREDFSISLAAYRDQMDIIKSDASKEEKQAALHAITAEAEKWVGYGDRARMQTAPVGYEELHEAYLTWADEITTLGEYWLDAAAGNGVAVDLFFDQFDKVVNAELIFLSKLTAVDEGGSTGPENTSETVQQPTEAADTGQQSGTRRSARGSSSPSEQSDKTQPAQDQSGRTDRTNRNVGQSGPGSSDAFVAEGSWKSPDGDVVIEWDDRFVSMIPESGYDGPLMLQNLSGGNILVLLYDGTSGGPDAYVEWLSTTQLKDMYGAEAELAGVSIEPERSSMVIKTKADSGADVWFYVQMMCGSPECTSVVSITVISTTPTFLDSIAASQEGIRVNGELMGEGMSIDEIQQLIS